MISRDRGTVPLEQTARIPSLAFVGGTHDHQNLGLAHAACFARGSVKIARHGNIAPGLAPFRTARIRDMTTTEETGQGTGSSTRRR